MLIYFKDRPKQLDLEFATNLYDWTIVLQTYRRKAMAALPEESTAGKFVEMAAKAKFALVDAKRLENACSEWRTDTSVSQDLPTTTRLSECRLLPQHHEANGTTLFQSGIFPSLQAIQSNHIKLLTESADPNEFEKLSNSSLWVPIPSKSSRQTALEYRDHTGQDHGEVEGLAALVREIAQRLSQVDASAIGLLRCKGFSHELFQDHFTLHFEIPEGMVQPKSLRTLLADPINKSEGWKHSIGDRIRLANAIASAVLYMHIWGFVHKNIQPENIIIFESATRSQARDGKWPFVIGTPFLVGYDGVRHATAESKRLQTSEWQKRIYLAPGRLNMTDNEKFHMRHDVYSLGVVLLEIALWTDFTDCRNAIGSKLKTGHNPAKILLDERSQVSAILGDKYHTAVRACLTELREEKAIHVLDDQDGIVQGRAYIDQVMSHLEKIIV